MGGENKQVVTIELREASFLIKSFCAKRCRRIDNDLKFSVRITKR